MPDTPVFINTSPLFYLHQVGQLEILPKLYDLVITPKAVEEELSVGRERGIDVPEPQHSIMELEGLGKEIWQGVDAQEYVNRERASWNG